MIDRKEKQGNLLIYYVSKDYDNTHLENVMNTNLTREDIQTITDHDADVYGDPEGKKLLLRFRKKQLTDDNVKLFYNNVINFAMNKTSNRGSASGSTTKNVSQNPKIMSNLVFWGPRSFQFDLEMDINIYYMHYIIKEDYWRP